MKKSETVRNVNLITVLMTITGVHSLSADIIQRTKIKGRNKAAKQRKLGRIRAIRINLETNHFRISRFPQFEKSDENGSVKTVSSIWYKKLDKPN